MIPVWLIMDLKEEETNFQGLRNKRCDFPIKFRKIIIFKSTRRTYKLERMFPTLNPHGIERITLDNGTPNVF